MDSHARSGRSPSRETEQAYGDLWWLNCGSEALVFAFAVVFALDWVQNRGINVYLFLLLLLSLSIVSGFRILLRFCRGTMAQLRQFGDAPELTREG
jgi:hypothetical protein